MQLHELKKVNRNKKVRRVGRGGKRGTYSGRGMKGQKQRTGYRVKPLMKEIFKRYPKLRGYRSKSMEESKVVVNLKDIVKAFKDSDKITPESFVQKGIIGKIKGKMPEVKILGKDALDKKFFVENCKVSLPAKQSIEKAGGEVKL